MKKALIGLAIVGAVIAVAIPSQASSKPAWTLENTYGPSAIYQWKQMPYPLGADCSKSTGVSTDGTMVALRSSGAVGNCAEIRTPFDIPTVRSKVVVKFWTPGNGSGKFLDWPAIWMSGSDWPVDGEIDGFEAMGGTSYVTYHYGSSNSQVSTHSKTLPVLGPNIKPGWNTIGFQFDGSVISVFYNQKLYTKVSGSFVTQQPLDLIMDVTNSSPGVQSTMRITQVRVYG